MVVVPGGGGTGARSAETRAGTFATHAEKSILARTFRRDGELFGWSFQTDDDDDDDDDFCGVDNWILVNFILWVLLHEMLLLW